MTEAKPSGPQPWLWRVGQWPYPHESVAHLEHEIIAANEEAVRRGDGLHAEFYLGGGLVDCRAFDRVKPILDDLDAIHRRAWEGSGRTERDVERVRYHACRAMFARLHALTEAAHPSGTA